jgi:hypothetical protein
MQAIEHDGKRRMIEPFDKKRMDDLLEEAKVKEVRVFKLKKGMKIKIEDTLYKVSAVRQNGKITLRPVAKKE